MCGIFGYVGDIQNAAAIVLAGLKALEYRGYDSWGIAVGDQGGVSLHKQVGRVGQDISELPPSGAALGHTRWATHGGLTRPNAHPHVDCAGRLAIIHNGIVGNHAELRSELIARGHHFRSETDSEVIAHLVEDLLDCEEPEAERLLAATVKAFRRLSGLNAIVVLDGTSGRLAAAKNGSPLVVGHAGSASFLSSDASALLPHTVRVTYLDDGQAVGLGPDGTRLRDVMTGRSIGAKVVDLVGNPADAHLGGFPDFMSKEIAEQPAVLRRSAAAAEALGVPVDEIAAATDVYVIGCGSAGYAGLAAQYILAAVARRRVWSVTASEFAAQLPFVRGGTLVVALSQSGETMDVLEAVRAARVRGARVAAVVNVRGSSLWRMADISVGLEAGPERCVLATKSFVAKLAVFLQIAILLKGGTANELLDTAAVAAEEFLQPDCRRRIAAIATRINAAGRAFVLGRGVSYPLALESALKIKEVSYLHAEAFAAGELKHGVIALIEPETPCIIMAPSDDSRADTLLAAAQVRARGAIVIGIASVNDPAFDFHIPLPSNPEVAYLVQVIPSQLIGYELARLRGHDPDYPRHLAKSVTVK